MVVFGFSLIGSAGSLSMRFGPGSLKFEGLAGVGYEMAWLLGVLKLIFLLQTSSSCSHKGSKESKWFKHGNYNP